MPLSLQQRDLLLNWAERQYLDRQQLSALAGEGQLAPASSQWQYLLDRLLAGAGVLLVSIGVVFFFAWNWDELPRFAKFAVAAGVLSSFTVLALFSVHRSVVQQSALLGCCIATGALLALIGQTYQTGADIWQLFAAWAVLMLPWVLLSRSTACWALCWAVANLALLRFFAASMWFGLFAGFSGQQALLTIALANLAALLLFEIGGGKLLGHRGRSLPRLCALAGLSALLLGAIMGWWQAAFAPLLIGFALSVAVGVPLYRWWRLDLPILALLLFGLVALGAAGLFRVLIEHEGFFAFNAIGLFVVVSSALASLWLHRVYRGGR
ncbi:DUF2157 domain-containing protein [Halopseudomonas pelagia]|uniref:DUF2157 domain-containing protein n=1 Tax=Halopseudomonas pelagia TaxID=553151 RepID=UPI0003AAEB7A|nr:DUF2157 domain-containing protein [Halopseudomonas pelagia]